MNEKPEPIKPIVHVRRGQKAIATNYRGRDLCEYLDRENFKQTAREIAEYYFPETYRKKIETTIEQVEQVYVFALVLSPYLQRLKGTYRPSWNRGTLLSWFRRGVSSATRQWYFSSFTVDEAASYSKAIENAQAVLGIEDVDFLTRAMLFLDNLAHSDGMKSVLAQGFFQPVAFAHIDEAYRQLTQFDATPKTRKLLRVMKKGTASYIRRGRTVYVLADRYCKSRLEGEWKDLREEAVDVWDYRLSFRKDADKEKKKEGVHIDLRPERLAEIKAEVKEIVHDGTSPARQIHKINKTIGAFANTHKYATGAGSQLSDLDKSLYRIIRDKIGPHYPQFKDSLWSVKGKLYMPLMKPILNPFLDTKAISENTWRAIWNPYR